MRKATIALIVAALVILLTCCKNYEPAERYGDSRYKTIVIIGMDGGGGLFIDGDEVISDFEEFFSTDDSCIGYTYRCETPSISAQNWGAYLHGVTPDKLEVTNIKIAATRFTIKEYPSVFKVIHDADPSVKMASFCRWNPINYGLIETNAGVYKDTDIQFGYYPHPDAEVRDRMLDYYEKHAPELVFVHFDEADEAGHEHGFGSPEHRAAIRSIEEKALEIFNSLDPETTLFILITDHGGTPEGTHGGDSDVEMHITFAIRGKGLNPAALQNFEFRPRDLSPIILTAMRIGVPSCMDGKCPEGLFSD